MLIRLVRRWQPDRELILVGDSAFAVARLGHTCRRLGVRLVSRLLLTAQLYDPVPLQPRGKPGVKPKKGPRQAKLQDRLAPTDPAQTPWLTTEIDWYAGQRLPMEVATQRALWHRDGEAPLPIRWVLLRDPSGERDRFALLCTDDHVALQQIIAWYVCRWHIEVTFQEARAHLGLGDAAPLERPGGAPHDAVPPRPLQPRPAPGAPARPRPPPDAPGSVVHQAGADVRRCVGGGPAPSLARDECANPYPALSSGQSPVVSHDPPH